jgi:hypothetical protein
MLMRPPSPSVSPLPSFASRPDFVARPVSFIEALRVVWRWLAGRQPQPSPRELMLEARLVEALAEELEAGDGASFGVPAEKSANKTNGAEKCQRPK